ncbi:MAG: serine/threonine protein kinase [Bacteroidales bacterium]|nr:serine/threonine protein kinase [Bacteroidales bacterium]
MSITGGLLASGVRYVFNVSADHVVSVIEKRMTDHSQALPKALSKANDRAWTAVGLALNGDSLFDRVKDIFRDADMKGVRDQIKNFLDHTPTGLEDTTASIRAKAAEEWTRLRKAGRFVAAPVSAGELARRAATMERHGDPARMTAAAHHAVKDTAEALRDEAPVLADLLTAAPDGGTPLLAAAFAFFFRREVETNTELAHGLSFDYLKLISERQERGLDVLDFRTAGILDQINVLFDALEKWFAAQAAKQEAIHVDVTETKEAVRDLTVKFQAFLHKQSEEQKAGRKGGTFSSISDDERKLLLQVLAVSRRNPKAFSTEMLDQLGDTMNTERMFDPAAQAHEAAAAAANASANRDAEAAQHYKAYLSACDGGDWEKAADFLRSAAALRPDLYRPFHPSDYEFVRILGAGAFGTVFHCRNEWHEDVAIKSLRSATGATEAWTLRNVQHPAIIGVRSRGYGNKDNKTRPYIVMDFFPGVTLDQFAAGNRPWKMSEFLFIARQVAEAVNAAHSLPEPVYHRDIKPTNIMVQRKPDDSLVVKVIDFGLARRTGAVQTSKGVPKDKLSTSEMSQAGTERYAPPEQTGEITAPIGPYSDVYAWGMTFKDVLFGHLNPGGREWKLISEPYRSTLQTLFEDSVSPYLDPKHPLARLQSFGPVLEALKGLEPTDKPEPTGGDEDDIPIGDPIEEPTPEPTLAEPPLQPGEVRLVVNDHYNITRNLNPWLTEDVCRSSVLTVECVGMAGNPSFRFTPFDKGPAYGMKLAADTDRAAWGRITAAANDSNRVSLRVKFKVAPLKRGPETPIDFFIRVTGEITALGDEARALAGPDHGYDYTAAVEKLTHLTDEQARVWAENPLPEKELLRDLTDKWDRLSDLRKKIDPLYQKLKFNDPRLAVWVPQLLELDPSDDQMRKLQGRLPPPNEPPANPKQGDLYTLQIVAADDDLRAGRILTVPIPPPREGDLRAGCVTTLKWKPVPPRANPNK